MSEFKVDGKTVTEEEAYAAVEESARELYPNVAPHITLGLVMLRDKIRDVREELAANPEMLIQAAALAECEDMAGDVLDVLNTLPVGTDH